MMGTNVSARKGPLYAHLLVRSQDPQLMADAISWPELMLSCRNETNMPLTAVGAVSEMYIGTNAAPSPYTAPFTTLLAMIVFVVVVPS